MADVAFDRYAAPKPTPYHVTLANLLARRDPDLWRWFASEEAAERAVEANRFELVRRAEPIKRDARPDLYAAADEIAATMALGAAVTLHHGEIGDGRLRDAALYFDPAAAHIVFEGDALDALDEAELRFLIGHELAHHALWTADGGRLWAAYRMVRWAAADAEADPVFAETARLERLFTELYADRYGLWAVGDLDAALRAHVKIATGALEVSGAAYLAEAEAALDAPTEAGDAPTLGEGPLRAVLVAAWAHDPAAAELRARTLLETGQPLDRLDLLGRERIDDLAHWMLAEFLTEPWSRRDLVRGHAAEISQRLADDIQGPRGDGEDIDRLRASINAASPSVRRFLAYLLLDFATVDPQLDDVLLTAALVFARDFGLGEPFRAAATQELKTTKTKLAELERGADEILRRAEIALGAFVDAPGGGGPERGERAPRRQAV